MLNRVSGLTRISGLVTGAQLGLDPFGQLASSFQSLVVGALQ